MRVGHNDFCLINEHTKESSSTSTIVDVEFSKANITLLERLDALTPYNIYQVTMGAFSSIEYKKVLIFQFKRENVVYDLIVVFDFFRYFMSSATWKFPRGEPIDSAALTVHLSAVVPLHGPGRAGCGAHGPGEGGTGRGYQGGC